jgi:hypothetical protein
MEQNRILTRDLKLFLAAVVEVTKAPGTVERLLQAAERAEAATERYMAEQHELRCMKDEQWQYLARAGREHDERLRAERDAWDRELAEARKRLKMDEDETVRRREWADKDRQAAQALRSKLEQKFAPAHEALGKFASAVPADPELSV